MKRILFVCLLGIAVLMPHNKIVAASTSFYHRILDIYIEGIVLTATSDASSGQLVNIRVYNSSNTQVMFQSCSGYACEVNLSGLSSGTYQAVINSTNGRYTEFFSI